MGIPFQRLGIPAPFRKSVSPSAPRSAKIAVAKGLIPCTADVQLALLYVLAVDKDRAVAKAARGTMKTMPVPQVLSGITQSTFPKVLEFIAQFRADPELDERLLQLRSTPDRAAELVAARADKGLCEALVRNQERLLMTPSVYVQLHANPNCTEEDLQNAESFLRMHDSLPAVSERRPFEQKQAEAAAEEQAASTPPGNPLDDLFDDSPAPAAPVEDAIEAPPPAPAADAAAVAPVVEPAVEPDLDMFNLDSVGTDSTDLGAFRFDFDDDMEDFSWDLTREPEPDAAQPTATEEEEQKLSLEQKLREMTVGKKIKLAYMGNLEARKILVRDPNKIVAAAVVKSGRLTPNEVSSFAGNKNLHDEVVRLIASNKEFVRKYPVQVALVNNPKCPLPVALKLMQNLQKRDLQQLANNRNVPSAIFGTAMKMFKSKYRK
ncbi:MAG: hypothetical protein VX127_01585 [Myxococcota bacterium]|nr:hypothetical protein [Myxococcota bacterium]